MSATLPTSNRAHTRPASPLVELQGALTDWLKVGGATLLAQALGVLTSLTLRLLLAPAEMGIWQGLKLALSYGNYANLGVSKAAGRELSLAAGRQQLEAAQPDLQTAHAVNLLSSTLYATALLAAAAWIALAGGPWSGAWSFGLTCIAALTILQRYVTYQVSLLRAQQAFAQTARLTVAEAIVTLLASLLFVTWWGLPGLYAATLSVLLASLLLIRRQAHHLAYRWDWSRTKRLVAIGAPLLLAGMASSLFRSLDKLMILAYLPDREYQLGCYSLALMAATQLFGLANMLSIVMTPRYAACYGRTGNPTDAAHLALRTCRLQALLMSLAGGLTMLLLPDIFAWLLPQYRAGLTPLVVLIPGSVALALTLPLSGYLVAVNQPRKNLLALALSMAFALVANHWALTNECGLFGVAVATTAANILYLLILAASSLRPVLPTDTLRSELFRTLLLTLPALGVAGIFSRESAAPAERALQIAALLATWSASAGLARRLPLPEPQPGA